MDAKPCPFPVPVHYTPAQVAHPPGFSPSAAKPGIVVSSWEERGFAIERRVPSPVTRQDLHRAHSRRLVNGVLDLKLDNGFGNRSEAIAASLPFTSGAMLSAAKEALLSRLVACAPVSGFHHAGYDECGLFCTFNGLMVTALALKAAGAISRIGILDFDNHYGNGTEDIIQHLDLDWVSHYSAGRHYHDPAQAEGFLASIPHIVRRFTDCDLLLYQAGVDAHIDDELGGWLTTAQLRERDRLVFRTALHLGLPVAWNLAGGYQTPLTNVIRLHDITMEECCSAYAVSGGQARGVALMDSCGIAY